MPSDDELSQGGAVETMAAKPLAKNMTSASARDCWGRREHGSSGLRSILTTNCWRLDRRNVRMDEEMFIVSSENPLYIHRVRRESELKCVQIVEAIDRKWEAIRKENLSSAFKILGVKGLLVLEWFPWSKLRQQVSPIGCNGDYEGLSWIYLD